MPKIARTGTLGECHDGLWQQRVFELTSFRFTPAWRGPQFSPTAKQGCITFLEDVVARRGQGFLMIGPQLLKSGMARLTQWDGHELIHVDLTQAERTAFMVPDDGIVSGLELPSHHIRLPQPQFSISDVEFDTAMAHNGNRHLAGWCRVKSPARSDSKVDGRYVLEASYFRPDLPAAVRSFWHFPQPHYWS